MIILDQIMQFLLEKSDENHPLTVQEMIDALAKHDISAERKSIYDDLEALRLFGLDIVQSKGKTTGYYIASRDFELPELKLLVDSVQSSKFITHKKPLALIKKIESLASVYDAQLLQRQVYVRNRVKSMNESVYYNVDEISNAINADRQIRFLPEDMRQKVVELRPYLVDHALTIDDLPDWVKLQFKEGGDHALPPREGSGVDYAFGNIVVMYQATATYNGGQSEMLAREARSLRVDGKPITVATGAFVYADMLNLVKTDGLQISIVAIVVILLLAALQKRRFLPAIIVSLPSILGIVMTLVLMGNFDLKLGLFNMVMLPVTLGISIDGAIYLFERYQQLGRGSVLAAVRKVISPVFMSSATTLVGFGGMILSRHMGLNSMGKMAIIGISICFLSTFLIQPGLIVLCEKFGFKSVVPERDYDPEHEE